MQKIILFFSIIVIQITTAFANPDAAIIRGHVLSGGEHLPYMNVVIRGTTIGTITDESGHFKLEEAPLGKITVIASGIGYKAKEITVTTQKGKSTELHFNLEVDALGIEELVVSAD